MNGYIYEIKNLTNNKRYIGSTLHLARRKTRHFSSLKLNKHHNIHLQRSYNKYGKHNFEFIVLKTVEVSSSKELQNIEAKFIQDFNPEYNIGGTTGGDNLTNHPNRDDILKRRSKTVRENLAKLTKEERQLKYGKKGETNPNWKGGASFNYCRCGTQIAKTAKTCATCRDRKGKNNPFYGKTHSDETKKIMSENMKGRVPVNAREIFAEGNIYPSMAAASRAYNITNGAMYNRINSASPKWEEFFYCDDVK